MNILYMNQGGGGQWGAIKYSNYNLILLAESAVVKQNFTLTWSSQDSLPVMSIQQQGGGRVITAPEDLDAVSAQVRPIMTFTIVGDGIRVVFVHLKSASEKQATDALTAAVAAAAKKQQFPTLWIGDFNRADGSVLPDAIPVLEAGGQAWWNLDRAYITGDWSKFNYEASVVSVAGADHAHAAIAFSYSKKV
jgi:hypothetical protein